MEPNRPRKGGSSEKIRNNSTVDGHTTQFRMHRYSIMYIIIRLQSRKRHFMDVRRRSDLEERRRYSKKKAIEKWWRWRKRKHMEEGERERVTRKAQRTRIKDGEDNFMRVFMVDGARVLSGIRTEVHWVSQASYFVHSFFSLSILPPSLLSSLTVIASTWLWPECVWITSRERVNTRIAESGRDSRQETGGGDSWGNAGKYIVDNRESSRKYPKIIGKSLGLCWLVMRIIGQTQNWVTVFVTSSAISWKLPRFSELKLLRLLNHNRLSLLIRITSSWWI